MWLIVLLGTSVAFALSAAWLERLNITGPMVYLGLGALLGVTGMGPSLTGFAEETFLILMTFTLALLLFADAATVRLRELRANPSLPARLLLVGLPLTWVAGLLGARALLPYSGIGIAALIGIILAPTDVSLGLAMFGNDRVPGNVRRAINVESGLNDGLAAPLVAVAIAIVVAETEHLNAPIVDAFLQIGFGAVTGIVVGVVGGVLLRVSRNRAWSSRSSRRLGAFGLAALAYVAAAGLQGNGFVAAFVAGLVFGSVVEDDVEETVGLAEETGTLLSLVVWFVFGLIAGPALVQNGLDWRPVVYAVLSLTVFRMVPVAMSMWRSGLQPTTRLFMGWFGPRGLASVIFLLDALVELRTKGIDTSLVVATVGWTVVLSVVLHGLSAGPVAAWYARVSQGFSVGSPELRDVEKPAIRSGLLR